MRLCEATSRWIVIACIAIIGVVWLVTAERIEAERNEHIRAAYEANANLALAFEEQTVRTIKVIDQALTLLRQEYLEEGVKMPQELFDTVARIDKSTYNFIGITDAYGNLVRSTSPTTVNVADRDYFQYHRDHPDGRLHIGRPILGRASKQPGIPITRRIERPDGSFAGIVIATVSTSFLAGLYDGVKLGKDGLIELLLLDGTALARHTGVRPAEYRNMSGSMLIEQAKTQDSGSFLSRGRSDGIRRYTSFRVMRDAGLVVSVGESAEHALNEAGQRAQWYLLGSSLATLFVILFGAGIVLALNRQQRAIVAARAGEALYRVTFDQAAVGIAHCGIDGKYRRANAKYCEIAGYSEDELKRMTFMEVVHPDDMPSPERMRTLQDAGRLDDEERIIRKDGSIRNGLVSVSVVSDPAGKPDYFVAMVQDITERKKAQEQVARNAHYDALTGLPNRTLLFDRLAQTLKHARRKEATVGLLLVDLDRFKNVNDTLGHENGDLLLRAAADRLSTCVRGDDTVARVGGDEFVVALAEIADTQDAARVAKKLIDTMSAPFVIAGREVFVTASVGIAIFPGDGPEAEILLNNANAAMLRAKQIGRNNFQFYTTSLNVRSAEKLLLESDLRRALERREFVLHYQPKVAARDGRIEGFEALIRWKKADGSLVPPGVFIPLLEESGLIVEVGAWVIRAACAQLREWQRAGRAAVPVAVNVSAMQFLRTDLCGLVEATAREFGVEPSLLEVEITESDVMQDPERVVPILRTLTAMGVNVAIDDFGTGYSSLAYLAKLPIQTLKIDRSFISNMQKEANELTLVSTMISLAHSLKLKVVAEGVETEEQARLLTLLRCDQLQGYLRGRPMPATDCTALLGPAKPAAPERAAA